MTFETQDIDHTDQEPPAEHNHTGKSYLVYAIMGGAAVFLIILLMLSW